MSNIKLAVIASDLHCGSEVGLSTPYAEIDGGNQVTFGNNAFQEWLWACWLDMQVRVGKIIGEEKFVLIVNGDATEGVHHGGSQVISNKIEDHCKIATECLMPLAEKAHASFVTKGTECHTRDIENMLAARIGAETGKAKDKWHIELHGCLVDVAHHMPTSSRRYLEAGALSITMGNARQNCLDAGHRAPRVFLRGHRHCGGWYDNGHSAIGVTGGFQMLTRHGHKVVTDSIPHPTVLVLDWRHVDFGSIPQKHLLKYDPPEPQPFRV